MTTHEERLAAVSDRASHSVMQAAGRLTGPEHVHAAAVRRLEPPRVGADSLVLVHRARSHSERVAILRAAHVLEQRGMIQLASEVVWGRPHLVAWAVGATPPESLLVVGRDGKTYRRPVVDAA